MANEPLENGYPARIVRLEEWRRAVDAKLGEMPSAVQVAVMNTSMVAMNTEIARQGKAFDQFVEDWKQERTDEGNRRSARSLAIWAAIVTIVCCMIGAITLVLVSLPHL